MKNILIVLFLSGLILGLPPRPRDNCGNELDNSFIYEKKFESNEELDEFMVKYFENLDLPFFTSNIKNSELLELEYYRFFAEDLLEADIVSDEAVFEALRSFSHGKAHFETLYKDKQDRFSVLILSDANYDNIGYYWLIEYVKSDPTPTLEVDEENKTVIFNYKISSGEGCYFQILIKFNDEINNVLSEKVRVEIIKNLKFYLRRRFYSESLNPKEQYFESNNGYVYEVK